MLNTKFLERRINVMFDNFSLYLFIYYNSRKSPAQ